MSNKKNRKKSNVLLILKVTLCIILAISTNTAKAQNTKDVTNKVLVLSSYYQGYIWAGTLESSIVSHFANTDNWKVEVDYLDLVANRDSIYMRQKAEKLMSEHKAAEKNIVVLLGEEAWIMYRSFMSEEWKKVPCVALFSGTYTISASDYSSCREITEDMKISLEDSRKGINATLINDPYFVEETLNMALQLKPKTENVVLVSDTWQIGYMVRNITRNLMKKKYPKLKLINLNNNELTTEELEKRLGNLPANSTVLFDSWFSQNKGKDRAIYPDNAMRLIAGRITGDAVFGLYDMGIREGSLAGGVYPTFEEFEAELIKTIEMIEQGKQPRDIPLTKVVNVSKYLNYNTLQKYGICETLYPKDAIYYGKPMGFIERNGTIIIVSLVIVLLMIVIVSIVAFYERTLKRQTAKVLSLTQKNERGKTEFIAYMGNLIRSPLNAIQMAIDMIDPNHLSEEDKSFLEIVSFNKSHLLNIFDDIVDLGKINVYDFELYPIHIDVCNILINTYESLKHGNGVEFYVNSDNRKHSVNADPKRLAQVLTYAILNADYYKTNEMVNVHYESQGSDVVIKISCAANFCESDCTDLFDLFNERTNPSKSGRSNLELPLCRKLMQAMGGSFGLERQEGDCWAFVIRMKEI